MLMPSRYFAIYTPSHERHLPSRPSISFLGNPRSWTNGQLSDYRPPRHKAHCAPHRYWRHEAHSPPPRRDVPPSRRRNTFHPRHWRHGLPPCHGLPDPPRRPGHASRRSGCVPSAGIGPLKGQNVVDMKGGASRITLYEFSFHIWWGDILNCCGRTSSPGFFNLFLSFLSGYKQRVRSPV